MLRQRKLAAGAALGALLFSASCSSNLVKSLSGLNALRQRLITKYGDQVTVNLSNSRYLHIVFVNSPLNYQDSGKRLVRAQETAIFISSIYEGINSIDEMWVSFLASERRFIFFHYNRGLDAFGFDRTGKSLDPPTSGNDPVNSFNTNQANDPRDPVARYIPQTNQTDISVTRIQLEGTINRGVALVPHFNVTGDARNLGTATPAPEFVVLDFASYADKPSFKESPRLEIYCDEALALKGTAQLVPSSESGIDETVGQFLTVRTSFKLFQRMATSKRVRILLGQKEFSLSPADINALARMTAYVPAASPQ